MIEKGTIVTVHYTGKFEDGEVFDTSEQRGPMRFEVGTGQIIPGFENALIGKDKGDKISVTIEPKDGYGEVNEEYITEVSKKLMPENVEVGMMLEARNEEGGVLNVFVKEIAEETVTIDANSPLAGKTICFDIEVVEVENS